MPGIIVPSRRRRPTFGTDDEDEDEDDGQKDDSVAETPTTSRNQNKRPRLSHPRRHTREGTGEDSWMLSPPGTVAKQRQNARSHTNGLSTGHSKRPRSSVNSDRDSAIALSDGAPAQHQPGSIVRVAMTNFVTYTSASFFPGPALNMVIGPNGTGKSTLVCAICLGLGWGTKHLGRAKDIGEFVKHGCSEATIEIELKGRNGEPNSIFKRQIKKKDNKSTWHLNGQVSGEQRVRQHAESFAIQVDNLCQFLPQDRVVEFAQMNPVEMLASTQRAAAPVYMTEWHEELKKLRAEQKNGQREQKGMREQLANLENRQNLQRVDVERIRERTEVLAKIETLEKLRPFAEYAVAKQKHDDIKRRKQTVTAELKKLTNEVAPALRAVNAKQSYKEKIEKVIQIRKRLLERGEAELQALDRKHKAAIDNIGDSDRKRNVEQKSEKDRKNEVVRIEGNISRIRLQMQQEPIDFDPAAYNERSREKHRQIRELEEKVVEIQSSRSRGDVDIKTKTQLIDNAQNDLKNLRSQAGQQSNKLRQLSADSATAWEWIQKSQDLFEGKIYGPPIVECSVTDKRYVNAIESFFRHNELTAFTCEKRNDVKKLSEQLYDIMKLSDISIRGINNTNMGQFQPPVNKEEMRALGFEGWAIDFLTGPDAVLAMICNEKNLHKTGVVLRDLSENEYDDIRNSQVSSWVTGSSVYQITRRREYGTDAQSTNVRQVSAARYWTSQPVDLSAERDLRDNLEGWRGELEELMRQRESASGRIHEQRAQIAKLQEEKTALEDEKSQKQRALAEFHALPTKLAAQEEKLTDCLARAGEVRKLVEAIEDEKTENVIKKGQLSIDYVQHVSTLFELHKSLLVASIAFIEAASDHEVLVERNSAVSATLKAKQHEQNQINRVFDGIHAQAKVHLEIVNGLDREVRDCFDALTEEEKCRTPRELDLEIESQTARLDLLHEGNPGAIKEFEDREQAIDRLKRKVADREDAMSGLDQQIAVVRGKWEPELDALVAKISAAFSTNFEKINCAGYVNVLKANDAEGGSGAAGTEGTDFDNWAVQVFVKFRENEQLALLTSQRQSGGERAVSTVFYLMALQSLSQAPFRVVDEINQGMDPRNERVVHERMVDIACGMVEDGGAAARSARTRGMVGDGQEDAGASGDHGENGQEHNDEDDDDDDGEDGSINGFRNGRMNSGQSDGVDRDRDSDSAEQQPQRHQTSQYFLITPKLLSNLKYSPGMKVHCIASGEFMPKDGTAALDFGKLARRMREREREREVGAGVGVGG